MDKFFDCILSWMEKNQVIVAVSIAVLGWIVNHLLSIRAQNKNFRNVVMNNARLEIMKAIKEYEDWLITVGIRIMGLPTEVFADEKIAPVDWGEKWFNLTKIFHETKSQVNWVYRLQDYEILFPNLTECREGLVSRHKKIMEYLDGVAGALLPKLEGDVARERKKLIDKANEEVGIVFDQIGLIVDLGKELQNICLSSLTQNKIPERDLKDHPNAVRLIKAENGKIEIYDPKIKPESGSNA